MMPSCRLSRRLGYGSIGTLLLLVACAGGGTKTDGDDQPDSTTATRLKPDARGNALVVLDSGDVRRLDLGTITLGPSDYSAEHDMPGTVVPEPERITTVRSAIGGRLVVEDGMQWPGYGTTVAAGAVVGRVADAKPLVIARGGAVSRIGAQPGELVEAGQVLLEITDYSHPMVKVAWLDDAGGSPPASVALRPTAGTAVVGRLVGAAPMADESSRAPAFLYRAERAWLGARPGQLVRASWTTGQRHHGVEIPASAVVQWDGLMWAYVEVEPGRFSRRAIVNDRALDRGWFADRGWTVGERVVVRGAQALLSEEFRSRITVGDETGD